MRPGLICLFVAACGPATRSPRAELEPRRAEGSIFSDERRARCAAVCEENHKRWDSDSESVRMCMRKPSPGEQGHAIISGTVVDGPQGPPLANITVVLASSALAQPLSVETDAQGRFRFAAIPAGRYTLVLSHYLGRDAIAMKECVFAAGGETVPLVIAVEPKSRPVYSPPCPVSPTWPRPSGGIEGKVRVRGGKPLGGVLVVARRADCVGGGDIDFPRRDGRYRLKELPPGAYKVEFRLGRYMEATTVTVGRDIVRRDMEMVPEKVEAELEFERQVRLCGCERPFRF